jgi:hypothetical protein
MRGCFTRQVWTGSEMIVWGGADDFLQPFNTGGRYDPGTDSWTATSTTGAPDARLLHTAVWTGSEMIVWGGQEHGPSGPSGFSNTGGRYCAQAGAPTPSPTPTATPGQCQFHVLIVYSDTGLPTQLQSEILAEPNVVACDLFSAQFNTPTLAQLQPYEIVVPFSNLTFADPFALGRQPGGLTWTEAGSLCSMGLAISGPALCGEFMVDG